MIFGGSGQNDIIGGNSNLFSLTTPQQRPDSGNVIIFAGAGTEIAEGDSQSTATVGGTATGGDVLSLSITWVSSVTGLNTTQTFSYTVLSGQSQANMVMGLLEAAQNNAALNAAGFSFTGSVAGNELVVNSSGAYTMTGAVGGKATETITIAQGGATVGTAQGNVHARNASVVVANNGDIFDLVGDFTQPDLGGFLTFNYNSGQNGYYYVPGTTTATNYYGGNQFVIPRAVELLDYTYGGPELSPVAAATDIGGTAEIHAESGDTQIYGGPNTDYLFGGSGNDLIIGGYGGKWIAAGNGITGLYDAEGNPIVNTTGILGGDGRLSLSRNTSAYGEPLYGIEPIPVTALNAEIATSGQIEQSTIDVLNALTVTADLTPYNIDPNGPQDAANGIVVQPQDYDDIIYGGLGDTFIHAGQGASSAISGAEALPVFWNDPVKNPADYSTSGSGGGILGYNASTGQFAAYNQFAPRALIGGTLNGFFLNFNQNEGVYYPGSTTPYDGVKVIFGDQGNDWIVGGNGANTIFGGAGNDLIDGRRNLTLDGGANDVPDNNPFFNSVIFGGGGSDILIAGGYYDRLIGGPNGANIYVLPVTPVVLPYTIEPGSSSPLPVGVTGAWIPVVTQVPAGDFDDDSNDAPDLLQYLFQLAAADGGDQLYANFSAPGVGHLSGLEQAQNGELGYEIGLAPAYYKELQQNSQTPSFANSSTVVVGNFTASSGSLGPITPVGGTWTLSSSSVQAASSVSGGAAIATFSTGAYLPDSFTVTAQVTPSAATSGGLSNGYILFDYVSTTNFKFAGVDAASGLVEIGHYNGSAWVVDASCSSWIRAGQTYNLTLTVSGDNATLSVNGDPAFGYSWQDQDGVAMTLNFGMVGLATNNASAKFNNVVVTVPVAAPTWSYQTNFNNCPSYLDPPTVGSWSVGRYGYTGVAPAGGFAIAPIDLGLAIGAAPDTFTLQPGSTIDISAELGQVGGSAGITFDNVNGGFKFAALISSIPSDLTYAANLTPMKAGEQYVVLGHYAPGSGFVIDAYQAYSFNARFNQTLDVIVDRDVVNVDVNNCLVMNCAYDTPVNGFGFGLLSWTGSNLFSSLTVTTNDPNLSRPFTPNSFQQTQTQGVTWSYNTSFNWGPVYYDAPTGGSWWVVQNGYQGVAPTNGLGIVTLDPALSFGLPAGALTFQSSSTVTLEVTMSAIGGRAGLVFNLASNGSFDFAALLYDTQQVVLGHYTTAGGFVIDDAQHYAFSSKPYNLTLGIVTEGNQVSVCINDTQVLSYAYSAVVTGGRFGILSWTGANVFRNLNISTNDPELQCSSDLPHPQVVQGPAPATWCYSTNFQPNSGATFLDAPTSGTWATGKQGYTGAPPAGGVGIVAIDPGLALNLPAGTFALPDGSAVQITLQFNQYGGAAGVVFDETSNGAYKFAALLSTIPASLSYAPGLSAMKVGSDYAVIGHYAPGVGFVIDTYEAITAKSGWNVNFQVVLSGDVVAINPTAPFWGSPCGQFSLVYAYGTVVTRGQFGLLSWVGSTTFGQVQVQTNAASLQNAPQQPLSLPGPLSVIGSTWNYTTNFNINTGAVFLDAPVSGGWSTASNGYTGSPSANAVGIAAIDPGLALGMPAGTFILNDGSATEITLQLSSLNGAAGVVFDMTANGAYKFAALLTSIPTGLSYDNNLTQMKSGTDYGVIGHYTPGGGFVIDAYQATTIKSNCNVTFQVFLNGDLAAMNLALVPWGPPCGAFSLAYNFGAVITRGQFGLLAWLGATTFQQLQIQTNDPYLNNAPMHMLAATAPTGPASGVTDLTMAEVDSLLPAAIDRLAATLSLNAAAIAELEAANIKIAELADNGLGSTSGDTITLSPDAAGWGWFVDPNPSTDRAFTVATAGGLAAAPGSAASDEMDLLTVEMHELAHVLGYGDTSGGLMSEYLTPGTRLAPAAGVAAGGGPTSTVGAAGGATANVKAAGSSASDAIMSFAPAAAPAVANSDARETAASATGAPAIAAQSAVALGGFGGPLFCNSSPAGAAPGGSVVFAPSAGGYAGSLIRSSIVVAPRVFGLSAGNVAPSDSFIQLDEYFGWSGALENGPSAAPQSPQVGDPAAAWSDPSSAPVTSARPAATPRIAWGGDGTGTLEGSDKNGDAVGQGWLDDFLVNLGQDESLRNPNAGIRVRPNGGSAAV